MERETLEKAKNIETCIESLKDLKEVFEQVHAPKVQNLHTALLTDDVLQKWRTLNKAFFETQIELKEVELSEL